MKKTTMLLLGMSMLGSSLIYANQQAPVSNTTVTIVNATQTNIHYEYALINSDGTSIGGGGNSQFTNEPSSLVVTLTNQLVPLNPKQPIDLLPSLHIDTAEEIDFENGNTLPNGMKGQFTAPSCSAKAGQTLLLEQAGNKQISCRVIG